MPFIFPACPDVVKRIGVCMAGLANATGIRRPSPGSRGSKESVAVEHQLPHRIFYSLKNIFRNCH
ncbi:hypothetical protein IM543_08270 [Massilia sp. UMI-21]|nr:hypothetical protein IM543_08270 [Massilia sp. UMI-21]